MNWQAILTSKTFWSGVGFVCLGIYQLTQGHGDQAMQSFFLAFAAWGLRHAIAKNGGDATGQGGPPASSLPFPAALLAVAALAAGAAGHAASPVQPAAAPAAKKCCICDCEPDCRCWDDGHRCRCVSVAGKMSGFFGACPCGRACPGDGCPCGCCGTRKAAAKVEIGLQIDRRPAAYAIDGERILDRAPDGRLLLVDAHGRLWWAIPIHARPSCYGRVIDYKVAPLGVVIRR